MLESEILSSSLLANGMSSLNYTIIGVRMLPAVNNVSLLKISAERIFGELI